MEMTTTRLPAYRKLSRDLDEDEENGFVDYYDFKKQRAVVVRPRSTSWYRSMSYSRLVPSFSIRRRMRLRLKVKVVGLRRLRRKLKLVSRKIRVSCAKVVKRFKEGQSHFGDLFAGNYMFLQVNPSSLKTVQRRMMINHAAAASQQKHLQFYQAIPDVTGLGFAFPKF